MSKTIASQPRLRSLYRNKYAAELQKELKLDNVNQVPRLQKIVINCGLGRAKEDKRTIEAAINTLRKITAQKPVQTAAKKSIAAYKLREGTNVGLKVTLRGNYMYEFLDRLINIVLPRLRDFHGLSSKAFDKQGNYSIGLTDQSVFPELTFEETTTVHGLQVTCTFDTCYPGHTKALLEKFGFPFEKPLSVVEPKEKPINQTELQDESVEEEKPE